MASKYFYLFHWHPGSVFKVVLLLEGDVLFQIKDSGVFNPLAKVFKPVS